MITVSEKVSDILRKTFLTLIGLGLVSSLVYRLYTNEYTAQTDLLLYIVENVLAYAITGGGLLVILKLWILKNYKEIVSDFLYIFKKGELENHSIYVILNKIFDHVYSLGHISTNTGRLLLFQTILELENLHFKVFISCTIQEVITSKERNNSLKVVSIFRENFKSYNEELIELMRHEAFPNSVINCYLNFKQAYIESILAYMENINVNIPTYFLLYGFIDVLSTQTFSLLKQLHYEIDHLNGELDGQLFRGHLL